MTSEDDVKSLHTLCGHCNGSGMRYDSWGEPVDCPNVGEHAYIENTVRPLIEKENATGEYANMLLMNTELLGAQGPLSQAVTNFAAKMSDLQEAARSTQADLDQIRDLLLDDYEGSTTAQIKAGALREVIADLHHPLYGVPDRCVCGESWSYDTLCAEARRISAYIIRLEGE